MSAPQANDAEKNIEIWKVKKVHTPGFMSLDCLSQS
jgi:hypothetical protein